MQAALGLQRVVVVQPTAYGFDNTCTMEAVAALGPQARAVAVVLPDVSDAELERLTAAGVRGLRFFMLPGGVFSWEQLQPLAARVAKHGWHVQLQLDGRLPLELMQRLAALVPRPRLHLIRFHGLLAPHAKLRAAIVASPAQQATEHPADHAHAPGSPARMSWALLLKRVFDIDVEYCANCGGRLKIIAAIVDPAVIAQILTHLH